MPSSPASLAFFIPGTTNANFLSFQDASSRYAMGHVPVYFDSGTGAWLPIPAGPNGLKVDLGTRLQGDLDVVSAAPVTDVIYNAGVALTPKNALANVAASSTDSVVITGVSSKKLRVLAAVAVAGATATDLTFRSKPAGAGAAISPLFANAANGGFVLPFNPVGWFETVAGEALVVNTGAGSSIGLLVKYAEV